jgi:kinesin family protein 15
MPRIFRYLFKRISEVQAQLSAQKKKHHWLVRCSMLEIYCEETRDLLQPTSLRLQLREDIRKGVFVEGLSEEVVQDGEANDIEEGDSLVLQQCTA